MPSPRARASTGAVVECSGSLRSPPHATSAPRSTTRAARAPPLGHIVPVVGHEVREPRARVERGELLEPADRLAVDEDLRHCPPAGALDQISAQLGIAGDVDLVIGDTA